ncbi:MAG TPA: UbiA family prenyltransferase [Jatrophihabitans sp.]|nr:UbiA family prenyltransferase [Jatrophihabitans sp.]
MDRTHEPFSVVPNTCYVPRMSTIGEFHKGIPDIENPSAQWRALLHIVRQGFLEARPAVQIIVALRFITAMVMTAAAEPVTFIPAAQSGLGVVLVSFSIYLANGIEDLVADIANNSRRPLASGRLSLPEARAVMWTAAAAGMVVAWCAGPMSGVCASVMLLVGLRYSVGSRAWKNRPVTAALTVGVLGACTYGAAAACGTGWPPRSLCLFGLAMSCWMALVGAFAKDFGDVAGDLLAGRRPACGSRYFQRYRVALQALVLGCGYLAVTSAWRISELRWSAITLLVAAASVAISSISCPLEGSREQLRQPYRAFMVGQYGVHLALLATLLS